MPKKILIVVSSLNRGGAENHIRQVFSKLHGKEFRVVVYTTHQPGVMAPSLQAHQVKVYSSRLASFLHRFGKFGRLLAYAVSTARLLLLNLIYSPDIVHCYLPGPYLLGGFCARLTRRPHLLMSRRSMNFYQKKYQKLAKYEKKLHKKTSRILANSKRVFDQLLHEESINKEKLRLVYNGIDLNKYQHQPPSSALKKALDINNETLVMTIVANLFSYKGHIDLLKALLLIKDRLPDDWMLLCVGRDEGCLHSLTSYAAEQGISSHIQWLEERDDVPLIYSISDIGILCSHEEGFSNSVIEGMAAGLPMLVTDVGGNAEAVIDKQSGLVVPPRDPKALGTALLTLIQDPSLREQMGNAAAERVKREFSLANCVEAYRQMYRELN